MENKNVNIAVWFEIPSNDFDRAVKFYQDIFSFELVKMDMGGIKQGLFPHDEINLVSGSVVNGEGFKPSSEGSLVYLNGGEDLNNVLSKVEEAGGSITLPKTHLSEEIGYIAHFMDSEGNRVGIHSMN